MLRSLITGGTCGDPQRRAVPVETLENVADQRAGVRRTQRKPVRTARPPGRERVEGQTRADDLGRYGEIVPAATTLVPPPDRCQRSGSSAPASGLFARPGSSFPGSSLFGRSGSSVPASDQVRLVGSSVPAADQFRLVGSTCPALSRG
ncbi:MAG: hypothetical protein ACR2OB_12520 [Solirubrobacteraceae bacterium]